MYVPLGLLNWRIEVTHHQLAISGDRNLAEYLGGRSDSKARAQNARDTRTRTHTSTHARRTRLHACTHARMVGGGVDASTHARRSGSDGDEPNGGDERWRRAEAMSGGEQAMSGGDERWR